MSRDPLDWLAPLVALVLLALVLSNTLGALRSAGAFAPRRPTPRIAVADPFESLDRRLAEARGGTVAGPARDPFGAAVAPAPTPGPAKPTPRRPAPTPLPAPPAKPTLTAIVFDSDPRALLLWDGRQYTVRAGSLFDNFRVASITRDRVVLERGGDTIVLSRPQGE